MCWSVVSKISFLPFFPLFFGKVMQPTKKIWPYSSSATQNQHESIFCFSFYTHFFSNGHEKKPLWRHKIKIFKKREKCPLTFSLRVFVHNFIKIGLMFWLQISVTDIQTYLIPDVNIFSNEMTECRSIDFTHVTKR